MKDGKALELEYIPTEVLKLLDEEQTTRIYEILNHVYTQEKYQKNGSNLPKKNKSKSL